MSSIISLLAGKQQNNHLVVTVLPDLPPVPGAARLTKGKRLLVTYRQNTSLPPNHTLEREANSCVVNVETQKILCRPFDGGDVLAAPSSLANEARVLKTGVYVFLYAENGGWSYVSPTLSKEECRRLIETSKVVFPKNVSYTYCFEVRGVEEYIYGDALPTPTRLFLFAVRNNTNGGYVAINSNPLFKDVLVCENIPLRQGVTASTAGTANTGSWGVYVQYGNNLHGSVISPNKKKTKIFSMGNDYHMMYRILSTTPGRNAPVEITDADYSDSQKKIYLQMVKTMKKLADYHQAKLDSIPDEATEKILLSEHANDRYIVDMWTIAKATGEKVTPMIYYSSLFPIFAPQFENGGRVAWVNKILMDFMDDELENPEIKPWIPLSIAERAVADGKNRSALCAPPQQSVATTTPPTPYSAPLPPGSAPLPPGVTASYPPGVTMHAPLPPGTIPSPHVSTQYRSTMSLVAQQAAEKEKAAPPTTATLAVKAMPPGALTAAQQRNAARLAANKNAASAVAIAAGSTVVPTPTPTLVSATATPMVTPTPLQPPAPAPAPAASSNPEAEKRPDTNIRQDQYLTQTTTATGRSRSSLVIKQPSRH